ncbi:VOC family protein [Rhodopirellula sp. SWK7]|uniref:VOC family protein n=1 Tax=Rhodopirellula sp. SWK7 TaxID=595460 RepID=UPI0002BFF3FE|nr:VOC family protein [Rhodopirellula sp. SWK7]EMI40253.1 glyoxalase/bleomycin resistance protein/dioxygenase [Rhodopirellula sp. SWK7]
MTIPAIASAQLRIARPTDRLDEVVAFYVTAVGFVELGRFTDHDGFDGVMVGHPAASYHLEFTHAHGHRAGDAPSMDNLLVFYLPDKSDWNAAIQRFESADIKPVQSFNPYWDVNGKTYEDPDGYRIVIQHAAWVA